MKAYANDFVRTLFEHLQTEKNELKGFLMNLVEDSAADPFISNPAKEWGEVISQRATPWAKRLQLLSRVQGLVNTYKKEKKRYLRRATEDQDPAVVADFSDSNNLLNFLPAAVFYGQRPSVWWTLRNDIDLLLGTYKYGYANYTSMRSDTNLSFYDAE